MSDGDDTARPRRTGFLRGLPSLVLIAIVLAFLIKTFLIQVFYIPSGSMQPTLHLNDRVIVSKLQYDFRDPRRFEVIVFSNPNGRAVDRGPIGGFFHWLAQGFGISKSVEASCGDTNPDEDFIKRVIGLPGETVEGKDGAVYVDGRRLDEPYLPPNVQTAPFPARTVPPGDLFVMGDNRGDSCDSRSALGMVPIDHVIGRAVLLLWPPSRIGLLH